MLLVIFCLIRPIYSLFAKADFPDALWLAKQVMFCQTLQDLSHQCAMLIDVIGEYEDVIKVDGDFAEYDEVLEDVIHESRECAGRVC